MPILAFEQTTISSGRAGAAPFPKNVHKLALETGGGAGPGNLRPFARSATGGIMRPMKLGVSSSRLSRQLNGGHLAFCLPPSDFLLQTSNLSLQTGSLIHRLALPRPRPRATCGADAGVNRSLRDDKRSASALSGVGRLQQAGDDPPARDRPARAHVRPPRP